MAVFRVRGLLGILSLLIVASIAKAEDPPRSCLNTGPTCIEGCVVGVENGNYQWCGSCQWFIQCNRGFTYYQPCPGNLYWNDNVKGCVAVSDTCTECVVDTTPNDVTESTIAMTTVIVILCESTGPGCISHCDLIHNGVYQWCARCDYFLQCSGSSTYYQACQPGLYYDQTVEACVYDSTTCSQCYEDLGGTSTTTKFDICWSSPCLNDATCISGGSSGFTCSCPDRYTGNRCETYVDPCSSGPCLNGATCLSDPTNPVSCICPDRYTGELCETFLDPCLSMPCLNNGSCIHTNSSISCQCPMGYTGVLCETKLYDMSAVCGDLLHSTPYDPMSGWTKLCEITKVGDAEHLQTTPCHRLLQGIPIFGDSVGLLDGGGNFGCHLSNAYPDNIQQACYDNYQHNHSLSMCFSCEHLVVCLRYPS